MILIYNEYTTLKTLDPNIWKKPFCSQSLNIKVLERIYVMHSRSLIHHFVRMMDLVFLKVQLRCRSSSKFELSDVFVQELVTRGL